MEQRRPRVGHIQFLNCLPLYWGLIRTGALADVELVKDTPDRLYDMLVSGELDLGADQPGRVPPAHRRAGAPARPRGRQRRPGDVGHLVSQLPLADLGTERVALGSTSRTCVLLTQMWLEEVHGVTPGVLHLPAGPGRDDAGGRGRGADRRRCPACHVRRAGLGLAVHDLGAAWRDWTGLPMVFAVWAVRRDYLAAEPGLVKDVHEAFLRSRDVCLEHVDEIAEHASRWESFDQPTLAGYFRTLDFSLGDRQLDGTTSFCRPRGRSGGRTAGCFARACTALTCRFVALG